MERRILQYSLLQGTADELPRLVNTMMCQGWEPLGGVAAAANRISIGRLDCTFIQAMVLICGNDAVSRSSTVAAFRADRAMTIGFTPAPAREVEATRRMAGHVDRGHPTEA